MEDIKAGFEAVFVHTLYKVFSEDTPPDKVRIRQVRMLKNESAHFQCAWRWSGYRIWGKIQVEAPEGIEVHVRSVENVPCAYPCHIPRDDGYLRTVPGLYPDLLKELRNGEIDLVGGFWKSAWLEVTADRTLSGGTYPVKVRILKEEDESLLWEDTIKVCLIDDMLPDLPVPHTEWFYVDCLADYYGTQVFDERLWEIVGNFMETAVRRGINTIYTPVFTPPLDTREGGERTTVQLVDVKKEGDQWHFSFDLLERWIALCKKAGFRYLEISHFFTQWGAKAAPKIIADVNGVKQRIFGWDTTVEDSDYPAFLRSFLPELTAFLDAHWEKDRIFFHISDEPEQEEHRAAYGRANAIVKPFLKDYQIMDAMSNRSYYDPAQMDIPVCATNHIGEFLDDRPPKLWAYYCTAQCIDTANRFIALPSVRNRILGWQMYRHRIDGFLHWGYNFYNASLSRYRIDPYRSTDADAAFPSGDPFLVYPGEGGKPEESIRLLVLEQAMNDLRALTLAEERTGREALEKEIDLSGLTFDSCMEAEQLLALRERVNDILTGSRER